MFGERLRTLRKEKNLTMKDLGKKFSVAESTISGYEIGNRKPDMQMLQQIADFFDVSTDYLLGRTDERTQENISTAFYDYENITDEEKEYLDLQLEIFRKMKEERKKKK